MNFVESDEEKDHERVDRLYDVKSVPAEAESALVITYRDLSHGRVKIAYCSDDRIGIRRNWAQHYLTGYRSEEANAVDELVPL